MLLLISSNIFAQSTTCNGAAAMCSGQGGPYNNTSNTTPGGNQSGYGPIQACGGSNSHVNDGSLGSTPRPAWFYYTIGQTGPIILNLVQNNASGNPIDVDFALWGPFSNNDLSSICNNLANFPGSTYTGPCNLVDASYSNTANENVHIPNAQVGEIYMLLVTNYSGQAGTYTINQTNASNPGAGQISCDIVCGVNLGPDQTLCADSYQIVSSNTTANAYEWFFNGVVIPGETTNILTVYQSRTYKVTITCGINNIEDEIDILLEQTPSPSGSLNQSMTSGSTLNDIEVLGQNILWYSSPFGGTPLSLETILENGETYYASQTINGCESLGRFPVIIQIILSTQYFDSIQLVFSPNPVIDILNIKSTLNLNLITIINVLGQLVLKQPFNSKEVQVDLSNISTGTYFVIVETDNGKRTLKVLKN